jgi:LysR family transcriptional activator of nhaA
MLEETIGEPLFNRVGRRLILSEPGHVVNHYADEIFSLGAELANRVRDKSTSNPLTKTQPLQTTLRKKLPSTKIKKVDC